VPTQPETRPTQPEARPAPNAPAAPAPGRAAPDGGARTQPYQVAPRTAPTTDRSKRKDERPTAPTNPQARRTPDVVNTREAPGSNIPTPRGR